MFSSFIHVLQMTEFPSFLKVVQHLLHCVYVCVCLYTPHFLHSSTGEHSDHFHILAIVSNAEMKVVALIIVFDIKI
jgi:hypothetical protein